MRDDELAAAVVDELERRGVPDALMLRTIMRLREAVNEMDRELARLQKYFTAQAPSEAPPS